MVVRIGAAVAMVLAWTMLLAGSAQAADVLPADGLVEVLPAGEVIGDGDAESVLHVVVRAPDGEPVLGAKLRASASAGTVDDVREVGDGIYAFDFTAPEVTGPTEVTVSVRGRTDALGPVEASRAVTVTPLLYGRVAITPNPSALVLGVDAEATLSIVVPPSAGPIPDVGDLLVRASSGDITRVVALGGGRFTARYATPSVNFPHLSIITVVDRRHPDTVWGSATIALQGKVEYPVTAAPETNVILRVGSREFGPVLADGAGKARVPVVVPPGVDVATQIEAGDAGVTESTLDLRVPDAKRLTLFDLPPSIPSDSRARASVRVQVLTPDGQADPSANLLLSTTAGRVSEPRHLGEGVYLATYTPPDGRVAMTASVTAQIGGSSVQTDSAEIQLVPPMPATLDLSTDPEELTTSGTGLKVFASLTGADGSGLPGRALRFRAAGATQKGVVQDLKGGDYRADFTADQDTDVLVRVVALSASSGNGASHLVLLPSRDAVGVDGSQTITVVAVDAFGVPVGGVPVDLRVTTGDGAVPAQVVTDDNGFAEVVYTSGEFSGLAVVDAQAQGVRGATAFYQAELDAVAPLPASGSEAWRDVYAAWQGAQGAVYVRREGGGPAPVGEADAADAGAPAVMSASMEPPLASPGALISLSVRVADAQGTGVPGATVEGFATGGAKVGTFQDLGGGQYLTTVEVPGDASGPLKINIVADGGAAIATVELPVSGEPVAAAAPVAKTPREPVERGDFPFLRLRASYLISSYTYEQTPADDSGGLLTAPIGWGGDRGGAPVPMGVEGDLRVFVPQVPYLGFQANFRYSRYAVESPLFTDQAVDNLFSARALVIGRVPIPVRKSQIHVGARAGFRYDDVITFRGCVEPGCTVSYEPVQLPGLDVGLEFGAEFWKMYLVASGSAGFAYGSVPYAANADFNLGFQATKNVIVDLGFGYQRRNAELEGGESGVVRGGIRDEQLIGTVGIGFSM